jgi:hypothetical protein
LPVCISITERARPPLDGTPGVDQSFATRGQNENPLTFVGGTRFDRAEHVPFRIDPARVSETSEDVAKPSPGNETWDILQEDELGGALTADAEDIIPYPTGVCGSSTSTGETPRLTGESCNDAIHHSTPRASIKGGDAIPDRSLR